MERLVECVPNFSEGQNETVIKEITDAIQTVEGVELLDTDMGGDTNRTVVTIIGSPEAIAEGAFQGIKKAAEVIDMRKHTGAHPRMGATDVCPFVPVSGVDMDECVEISKQVAERVGSELDISVFLYENSATKKERRNLATIRSGEYEGMAEKLTSDEWKPDYGPQELNESAGVTAIGAREFLIAYNINLNTTDRTYANEVAYEIRERGRWKREGNIEPFYYKGDIVNFEKEKFPDGNSDFVASSFEELEEYYKKNSGRDLRARYKSLGMDPDNLIGKPVYKDGRFTHVKGIGWVIPEYNRAQISMNLTNFNIAAIHDVYDAAVEECNKRGITVTGSEIVGLVPYEALRRAAEHYLKKMGKSSGMPVPDLVETAIQSLGLRDVGDFNPEDKVLGMPKQDGELVNRVTYDFVDEVSRDTAAPGGGSVAALAGALGVSLGTMVANLSASKAGFEGHHEELSRIATDGQKIKDSLVKGVDEDTSAFDKVIDAMRMPKDSDADKETRSKAMQEGYKIATNVPLDTVRSCRDALKLCKDISEIMADEMASDVGSGALMAYAGAKAAAYNVRINLKSIEDKQYCEDTNSKLTELLTECENLNNTVSEKVSGML